MKTKNLFFILVTALFLAACVQMENPDERTTPVSLSYSTVVASETKAAQNLNEAAFASGETVMVQIADCGDTNWTGYVFTTGEEGAMTAPTPGPHYPAGSVNINIVAYYPSTAGTSFTVKSDQTADADYKASDLMFASVTNQAKQEAPVNLAFSHKLAKLNVNISAGEGVSSISSVSILNVKPTVSFDQISGAVGEASGTATSIAVSNNGAAVIPAQTISGGLLSIVTDKGTATYSVTDKVFEAAKQYTLNITVNLRAVGTTTAITGWTSEGTVTVNPVSDPLTVLNATSANVGWVITTDGFVYQNKAAVDAAGKTPAAMIIHVGAAGSADASGSFRGLAVSMRDIVNRNYGFSYDNSYCLPKQYGTWKEGGSSDAATDMQGIQNTQILVSHTHEGNGSRIHSAAQYAASLSHVAGTSGWFLGSAGQWDIFLSEFCGLTWNGRRSTNGGKEVIDAKFSATGYPSPLEDNVTCCTSTEKTDDTHTHQIWAFYMYSGEHAIVTQEVTKAWSYTVLPFLAF